MAGLNQEKVQAIQEAIDEKKLLDCMQEISEERQEKAFANPNIKKLAEKLSEDADLFDAVMNVYDTDKSYEAAIAAVPGSYTKEEFDEFRTVYANLFLKDFYAKVFKGKDSAKLTDEELDQVAGGWSIGSIVGFVGKGVNCVVDKLPISDDAKKRSKLIVSTVSGVATVAIGTAMCATGVGAGVGAVTIASGAVDLVNAVHGAATLNKK